MGKQNRCKRSDSDFAKGKVTPIQVAFIVDRYLSDNNFSETRSVFRIEASSLISKSPVHEAPKSLLSLAAMLNEYICLKEQKVLLEHERARLDQERLSVQALLRGMQNVMNAYNASAAMPVVQTPSTRPAKSAVVVPQSVPSSGSPSGFLGQTTPTGMPVSTPSNTICSPVTNFPLTRKRMGSKVDLEALPDAKKSRSKLPAKKLPYKATTQSKNAVSNGDTAQPSAIELSPHNCAPNGSLVQGSSVAKSLFNQPSLPTTTNSSGPNTPPQPVSSSQVDKSPLGNSFAANSSTNNTPQDVSPTSCTVISSARVTVSPYKQMAFYTVERNHCVSSSSLVKADLKRTSKRDHVKGRLDFDGSDVAVNSDKPIVNEFSTSESEKEGDIFGMDLPNIDDFGANFSFSELLVDLDLDCEGLDYSCQPPLGASTDNVSGSSHESGDANLGVDQVLSGCSSTLTATGFNFAGSDTMTAVKSITKCMRILSPGRVVAPFTPACTQS